MSVCLTVRPFVRLLQRKLDSYFYNYLDETCCTFLFLSYALNKSDPVGSG